MRCRVKHLFLLSSLLLGPVYTAMAQDAVTEATTIPEVKYQQPVERSSYLLWWGEADRTISVLREEMAKRGAVYTDRTTKNLVITQGNVLTIQDTNHRVWLAEEILRSPDFLEKIVPEGKVLRRHSMVPPAWHIRREAQIRGLGVLGKSIIDQALSAAEKATGQPVAAHHFDDLILFVIATNDQHAAIASSIASRPEFQGEKVEELILLENQMAIPLYESLKADPAMEDVGLILIKDINALAVEGEAAEMSEAAEYIRAKDLLTPQVQIQLDVCAFPTFSPATPGGVRRFLSDVQIPSAEFLVLRKSGDIDTMPVVALTIIEGSRGSITMDVPTPSGLYPMEISMIPDVASDGKITMPVNLIRTDHVGLRRSGQAFFELLPGHTRLFPGPIAEEASIDKRSYLAVSATLSTNEGGAPHLIPVPSPTS